MVLKDNFALKDHPCQCCSNLLQGYIAPYTATCVSRLLEQGAIPIARANMDEFAMGSTCEHSIHGATKNPWDLRRSPGGSSGGVAALVAAGVTPLGLTSSTGGSTRLPAALTGTVGLKPTYGRCSRYGLVAFASSMDVVGLIGKTVNDVARGLQSIAGYDPKDQTTSSKPIEAYIERVNDPIKGLKIGVINLDKTPLPAPVTQGIAALKEAGAVISHCEVPSIHDALPCYHILSSVEAASNLARFDGLKYGLPTLMRLPSPDISTTRGRGFGTEVKRRILLGNHYLLTGEIHERAHRVRQTLTQEVQTAFSQFQILVTPSTLSTAPLLGSLNNNPLEAIQQDNHLVIANLTGIPSISVPCGLQNGLPVGINLMGDYFSEGQLLAAANSLTSSLFSASKA